MFLLSFRFRSTLARLAEWCAHHSAVNIVNGGISINNPFSCLHPYIRSIRMFRYGGEHVTLAKNNQQQVYLFKYLLYLQSKI